MHADGLITQLLYPAPKHNKPTVFALSPGMHISKFTFLHRALQNFIMFHMIDHRYIKFMCEILILSKRKKGLTDINKFL